MSQFFDVEIAFAKPTEAGLRICKNGKVFVSIYNTGPSADLVAGQPYAIQYKHTALKRVDVLAPATLITAANLICVPEEAIANNDFGWVQIYGECELKHAGTTTAGHYLEVLNTGTAFTTEGAATITVASCAVSIDGASGAETATGFLFGKQVGILAE